MVSISPCSIAFPIVANNSRVIARQFCISSHVRDITLNGEGIHNSARVDIRHFLP